MRRVEPFANNLSPKRRYKVLWWYWDDQRDAHRRTDWWCARCEKMVWGRDRECSRGHPQVPGQRPDWICTFCRLRNLREDRACRQCKRAHV